jgi:hypothetical protein
MTTANESDLQGKCSDLVRALDAERQHSATLTARIAKLNALIRTMDAAHQVTVKELTADIIRLTAENDLARELLAQRDAEIAETVNLARTWAASYNATVTEYEALIQRLAAENAALLLRESELPY